MIGSVICKGEKFAANAYRFLTGTVKERKKTVEDHALQKKVTGGKELIRARDLCVKRDGNVILDHIDLSIKAHDFITIIGPNGAGKSFLLRCLAGIEKYESGSVTRSPGVEIGYMPQRLKAEKALPITVKNFIHLRKKITDPEYQKLVILTEIEKIENRPLYALSGGELQRVLLARALAGKPDLLILDEPAQNLDITGQLKFYALLANLHETTNMAIVTVSHDLHLVASATKETICLYKHICCRGEPKSVANDPEFIALFGAHAAGLTAIYTHHHDHSHEKPFISADETEVSADRQSCCNHSE